MTIVQDSYTGDKTATEIEVTVDNRCLEVDPYHQLENLEMHQGLPGEIKIDVLVVDNLDIWLFGYLPEFLDYMV